MKWLDLKSKKPKALLGKLLLLQAPDLWALNLSSVSGGDQLSSAMHMHDLQVSPVSHQTMN